MLPDRRRRLRERGRSCLVSSTPWYGRHIHLLLLLLVVQIVTDLETVYWREKAPECRIVALVLLEIVGYSEEADMAAGVALGADATESDGGQEVARVCRVGEWRDWVGWWWDVGWVAGHCVF